MLEINDFKLSNGWLHKFKIRHNIQYNILHGEGGSVDLAQLERERIILKDLKKNYKPEDI